MTKAVYTCRLEVADGILNVGGNVNLKQQLKHFMQQTTTIRAGVGDVWKEGGIISSLL